MTAEQAEQALHRKIPLSHAMQMKVKELSLQRAVLTAPLDPNINHVGTGFGGSLYAMGALSCYALFLEISRQAGVDSDALVIQRGEIEYLAPVEGDFESVVNAPSAGEMRLFHESLKKRGRGRLNLTAEIQVEGEVKARFSGDYVSRI